MIVLTSGQVAAAEMLAWLRATLTEEAESRVRQMRVRRRSSETGRRDMAERLATASAHLDVLGDHPAEEQAGGMVCRRCRRRAYDTATSVPWPCPTVTAVARIYTGRDGWQDQWLPMPGPMLL